MSLISTTNVHKVEKLSVRRIIFSGETAFHSITIVFHLKDGSEVEMSAFSQARLEFKDLDAKASIFPPPPEAE